MVDRQRNDQPGLIDLAVERPVAVTMIVLAVAVFGLVSFQKLPMTLLPRISYPTLTVRTQFEGAAPSEVEELVTKPLEDNLSVIGHLQGFRSVSRAGVSDIVLEFEWDTNMNFAAQDVREKVDQVRPFLPRDISKPLLLKYDPSLDPVMRIGLYGDADLVRLRFQGEERLKKELESIAGVAAVKVRGGFESEIRIDLDENALMRSQVALETIKTRLQEENVNLASGILREGDTEYLVRTLNEFRTVDEIRQLIVATVGDRLIRLGDLARVYRGAKEPDVVTRINGRPSVEIAIFKEDSANIIAVAQAVKSALFGPNWRTTLVRGEYDPSREPKTSPSGSSSSRGGGRKKEEKVVRRLVSTLPPGMALRVLSDQSTFIEKSLDEVKNTGIQGAFFAILILLLFLRNLRSTLIIAVAIPVSVIATFGPMMQFDVSLNVMSLGGLALGIGMLVDASIVVLESIDRVRRDGAGLEAAAVNGTRQVAAAVVASVLTTVAVFFPIVFVEGVAGEIFRDQSLTVVFSLLASLAVAIFFIPAISCRGFSLAGSGTEKRSFAGTLRSCWTDWAAVKSFKGLLAWRRSKPVLIGLAGTVAVIPLQILMALLEFSGRIVWTVAVLVLGLVVAPSILLFRLIRGLLLPIGRVFDAFFRFTERSYGAVITAALRMRLLVVVLSVALAWMAWMEKDSIGVELIPEMHSGEIIVHAPQPVGTSLENTAAITARMEERIRQARDAGRLNLVGYASSVGIARDEVAPAGEGPHTARIFLTLPVGPNMAEAEKQVEDVVRKEFASMAEVGDVAFTSPRLFSFSTPLEIQVLGDDLARVSRLTTRISETLEASGYLEDIQSSLQQGSPEFVVRYDRVLLAEHGVTLAQASGVLRDKIKGTVPTRFSVPDEARKIDVLVKIPDESLRSVDVLRHLNISGDPSQPVRLEQVAEIHQGRGPSEIRHIGGQRAQVLTAKPRGVDLEEATRRIHSDVEALRRSDPLAFEGIVVKTAGQSEEAERSSSALIFALGLALVLVYIVMASQFESLLDPLVIMVSSVFAGVGAVFALAWTHTPASVVVFIGGIMLAGIVVNNAIVLIDCINRLHREGLSRTEAIRRGGMLRLRPIMMTTATTILGLLPMALSQGEGAEIRVPMALTVIAGLATSTVLTLVIIPVIYSLAHQGLDRLLTGPRGGR
ncbi:MAG TPA: efflux RND transporter permease subunit [Planctomycetes bacterium]|nr:efflux RND transporter permease subunit [Planctomycetota bacterium]